MALGNWDEALGSSSQMSQRGIERFLKSFVQMPLLGTLLDHRPQSRAGILQFRHIPGDAGAAA